MTIVSSIDSDIVTNVLERCDTIDEVIEFLQRNHSSWSDKQILWDMCDFDFHRLNWKALQPVLAYIKRSDFRAGKKTAVLVDSDLGFGMMRMLQMLGEGKFSAEFRVYRDRGQAVDWLGE